jgi:hypothetical protein
MKDEWHFGCKVTNKRAKSQILFEFFRFLRHIKEIGA